MKKPELDDFRKVVEAKAGNITETAKALGCNRRTVQNWLKEDPEFKQAHDDVMESLVDFAESQLTRKMNGIPIKDTEGRITDYTVHPDTTAIIFFLKTRGKERGYVERQEMTGKDGESFFEFLKQTSTT